jgi:hypothetical protein
MFFPLKLVVLRHTLPVVVGNDADHNRKDTMDSAVQAAMKLKVSAEEAHAELERELQVRHRIFDKWVADGKMSYIDARDRYARLQKAVVIVKRAADSESAVPESFEPKVVNA